MSDNEKLSVDRILDLWKADCGEEKTSEAGTTYLVVPIADRRGRLLDLIQAMTNYGHTQEEIRSSTVMLKVVKICWPDLIKRMSAKDIRKNRDITRAQWKEALDEFFVTNFPKYVKPEKAAPIQKTEAKKEKVLELDPKDRIKMDVSDIEDAPIDLDLLQELGLDESFVTGKKDE